MHWSSTHYGHSPSLSSGSAIVPVIGWWIFDADFDHIGNRSEVYSFTNESWIYGPILYAGTDYLPKHGVCTAQLNKTHTMLIGGDVYGDSIADVYLYDWTKGEWTTGPPMQTTRTYHSCTPFGSGLIMVAGGMDYTSAGQNLITTEVYDPEINSWYYSKDLPSNDYNDQNHEDHGKLINWNGSPLWIKWPNLWKFEEGVWTLLESTATIYSYKFAIILPDDFISDC